MGGGGGGLGNKSVYRYTPVGQVEFKEPIA